MVFRSRWSWSVAVLLLFSFSPVCADSTLGCEDLQRYGFGDNMTGAVRQSRLHEQVSRTQCEGQIPPPVLPSVTASDKDIPDLPSSGPSRLIQQGGQGLASPYEGPTRTYQGSDAKELEGTFKEVENFFFRPGRHYDRFLSMNEQNVTGLIQMYTGEVERKGTSHGRVSFRYTDFVRSFGEALLKTQDLEQFSLTMAVMFVPAKDLEISQSLTLIDERSTSFPLIDDYSLTGIQDVKTTAKYRFVDNPEDRLSLAFIFGIDVGVENTVTRVGSNGVDFSMALALTKRLHNCGLHLDGGWIFANGQNRSNSSVPDVGFAGVGLDFQTGEKLDWIVELNYTDFQDIGYRFDVTPGLKWRISNKWRFDLGIPISLRDTMAQGYNFRVSTAFQLKF